MYSAVWNSYTAGTEETRRDRSDAMKAYLHTHARVTLKPGEPYWTMI